MEILQAIILGIVQGASEFLPISSSGHLILVPKLFGWTGVVDSLSFDVALHLATSLAVIVYFWSDWVRLLKAFLASFPKGIGAIWKNNDARIFVLLIVGSIPAAIFGYLFQDIVEEKNRNTSLVALLLIIFALVLLAAEKIGKKNRSQNSLGIVDSLLIGVAQAVAIFPGVSRSGITISTGLFRNLTRAEAARFSFMLSTPIILGVALLRSKDIFTGASDGSMLVFVTGFIAAAVSSWLAIKFLLSFIQTRSFTVFVVYRILLGLTLLFITL